MIIFRFVLFLLMLSGCVAMLGRSASGQQTHNDYPPPPSSDGWIWRANTAKSNAPVVCFRREIVLDAIPKQVVAWISADWHYRLYINGTLVSRGPTDPGADYPGGKNQGHTGLYYCDCRELTPHFRKGQNVIAVEVFAARLSEWYGSSGHRGLFFQARFTKAGGAVETLSSDAVWKAFAGEYLEVLPDGLRYLPAKEPHGWRGPDFDDSRWEACKKTDASRPALLTSQIPPLAVRDYPASGVSRVSPGLHIAAPPFRDGQGVTLAADGSFALRCDRIVSAYVRVRVKGGAGAILHFALNEVNAPGGRRAFSIVLTGGEQTFETPFYSSFTTINVTASKVTTPVEIQDITAEFVSYPVTYRGAFECSDAHLNQLWEASRWAVQICMQDHYLDSPDHQEPICDPGDYLIESLMSAYAFGDLTLTRQELRKFAALLAANHCINFHTSYALLWLQMLLDYYDFTGDAALVRELSPQVFGLLDRFGTWRGKNGLISEAPDYMFMDWVSIAGIACHHPPAVIGQGYLTAFYYRALADGGRVAKMVKNEERAETYAALRLEIAAAFQRELWSETQGLYRDGRPFQTSVKPGEWLPADTDIETFSPHVNLLAVLYDLAPKERQAAIINKVMAQQPLNCQPYFYHFVFDALHHADLFEKSAPAELLRWQINPETQSFREMWDTGDWSHAWGGTPLIQMSARILGVTPAAPGFRRIAIRPLLCHLQRASGIVPTPHGDIAVAWKREDNSLTLDVTIPKGCTADITLPLSHYPNAHITRNGRGISADRLHQNADTLTVKSGTHHIVLRARNAAP